jgi:hypothetical protein
MDKPNQIHISIEQGLRVFEEAQRLHKENPNTVPIVRLSKTASRQGQDHEDKFQYELLVASTVPQNIEE